MEDMDKKLDEELDTTQTEAEETVNESEEAAQTAEAPMEEAECKQEAEAEAGEEDSKDSKDSKNPFKKKKADKKTEALEAKVTELEDKYKRQLAEFENFRNRTEKEKALMFETGAKSVIEKILPIVDNFERGLSTVAEEETKTPFAEGMEKIYKQLMTELEKMEVKPIEAVGAEFNPDLHNAVMQVESEEYESGVVAQELMKGYTYRGQVVRHSMVAVVQ